MDFGLSVGFYIFNFNSYNSMDVTFQFSNVFDIFLDKLSQNIKIPVIPPFKA